jgi:hypothetical protein
MLPMGIETTISIGERPQTYALDRAANGTGISEHCFQIFYNRFLFNKTN